MATVIPIITAVGAAELRRTLTAATSMEVEDAEASVLRDRITRQIADGDYPDFADCHKLCEYRKTGRKVLMWARGIFMGVWLLLAMSLTVCEASLIFWLGGEPDHWINVEFLGFDVDWAKQSALLASLGFISTLLIPLGDFILKILSEDSHQRALRLYEIVKGMESIAAEDRATAAAVGVAFVLREDAPDLIHPFPVPIPPRAPGQSGVTAGTQDS
ncbi:hypothetical protein [Streptomyces sp. MN13]